MKKKLITVLLILQACSISAIAQIGNDSAFGFLSMPGSARTAALGGNHVSLDQGDVSLFSVNPAYVDQTSHKQLSVSYLNHISDIYLGMAGFSYHLDGIGTLATGMRIVNYGDFTRVDSEGREQGSFNAYDFSWGASISRPIFTEGLQAGIGMEFISSRYDTYQSSAAALFGGLLYRFNNGYTQAGLSFQHLGFQLSKFDETSEDLPFTIIAGITHRLQHLPLRFNLSLHSLERWEMPVYHDEESPNFTDNLFRHVRFGTEILFSENVNLRLGYDRLKGEDLKTDRRIDLSGASIGLGITIRDITFDISRTSYSETGGLIQLNLSTML